MERHRHEREQAGDAITLRETLETRVWETEDNRPQNRAERLAVAAGGSVGDARIRHRKRSNAPRGARPR